MQDRHVRYLEEVVQGLRSLSFWALRYWERLSALMDAVLLLAVLDLEPVLAELEQCYADRRNSGGRRPRDPVAMLRSLVLMAALGETSVNKWVDRLQKEQELSILSGFGLDPAGVGTFYDFFKRLVDGPHRKECEHHRRASRMFRGSRGVFRRNLKHEKKAAEAKKQADLVQSQEGVVAGAVRQALVMLGESTLPKDFLHRMEVLVMKCAVVPSGRRGLLGALEKLDVVGDGSPLASQASGRGRPTCRCRQEGKKDCECDRLYSDPEARWGWDHYREVFVFGHRLHALVVKSGTVELPVHLMAAAANVPDAVMAAEALVRLSKLLALHLPEARILHAIFDAGYDATAFHRLVVRLGAKPVIALNERNFKPQDEHGVERDPQGIPLCKGKVPMRLHAYNRRTGKLIYHCPAKRPGRTEGKQEFKVHLEDCPLGCLCEPASVMGPLVNLSVEEDPRLNPPVPRGSEEYGECYPKRTASERLFSRIKEYGGLGDRPYRRQHQYLIHAVAQSLAIHAKAWIEQMMGERRPKNLDELLGLLNGLMKPEQREQKDRFAWTRSRVILHPRLAGNLVSHGPVCSETSKQGRNST